MSKNEEELMKLILNKIDEMDKNMDRMESTFDKGFNQITVRFNQIEEILDSMIHKTKKDC